MDVVEPPQPQHPLLPPQEALPSFAPPLLSTELWLACFAQLQARDKPSVSLTSSDWNRMVQSQLLWRKWFLQDFPFLQPQEDAEKAKGTAEDKVDEIHWLNHYKNSMEWPVAPLLEAPVAGAPDNPCRALDFDLEILAAGCDDKLLRLYYWPHAVHEATQPDHMTSDVPSYDKGDLISSYVFPSAVSAIGLNKKLGILAAGCTGEVRLYNVGLQGTRDMGSKKVQCKYIASLDPKSSRIEHEYPMWSISMYQDKMTTATLGGSAMLWDVSMATMVRDYTIEHSSIYYAKLVNNLFCVAPEDGPIALYDIRSGNVTPAIEMQAEENWSMDFDGTICIAGTNEPKNVITVWEIRQPSIPLQAFETKNTVHCLQFDKKKLAAGDTEGAFLMRREANGLFDHAHEERIPVHGPAVAVRFDKQMLACGIDTLLDQSVQLFKPVTRT